MGHRGGTREGGTAPLALPLPRPDSQSALALDPKKRRGMSPPESGMVYRKMNQPQPTMIRTLALTPLFGFIAFVAQHVGRSRLSLDFSDLRVDISTDEVLDQLCSQDG